MDTSATLPPQEIALASEGGAPEWVQLLPAGPVIAANDGRTWRMDDPQAVVSRFAAGGLDLPIDYEHATAVKAPKGEPAPAAGWIVAMDVRDGAVWGRVEWTEAGGEAVASRAYRYLSPGIQFSKSDRRVLGVAHAGLTNTPALDMAALCRDHPKETPMDLTKVTKALGLVDGADADQIETAICRLQDQTKAPPDAAKFAPRAELDAAAQRANAAETELATLRAEQTEAAIKGALDAAVEAGKIAPAQRDFYEVSCRQMGVEKFNAYVASWPVIGGGQAPAGGGKPASVDAGVAGLTPEELEVCRLTGKSPADFAKAKAEQAAAV